MSLQPRIRVKKATVANLLVIAGLLALYACGSDSLDDAFRRIYLAKYAVDFPSNEDQLRRCESHRVKACLDLVAMATDGKRRLLALEPTKALDTTLKTITTRCPLEDSDQQELCLGAITALYFFTAPELDAHMLKELMKAEPVVLHKVFSPSMFAWYYNRPQPQAWIAAVSQLPAADFPPDGKTSVLKAFGTSSPAGLADGVGRLK